MRERKLDDAKNILKALGLPSGQCNDRSAWVFLALANIKPDDNWDQAESPLLPTYLIMDFIRQNYGKDYKPNSRETVRRQTLHQFEQAIIVTRNRDNPLRATNSKDNNYSLNEEILEILRNYPNNNWEKLVEKWLAKVHKLKDIYKKNLDSAKVRVHIPGSEDILLSPGKHNELHAQIIHEFCSRFVGINGEILYLGDTASSRSGEGGKYLKYEEKKLKEIGVQTLNHNKLPDIVIFDKKRKWLFLIEAVTSHGPISPKRFIELEKLFAGSNCGKIYVTAFLDRLEFKRNIADIAWETEVWIAEEPDHMIHFNGDRFMGPR